MSAAHSKAFRSQFLGSFTFASLVVFWWWSWTWPFRFLNVWTKYHDFLAFISQKWSLPTHHTKMASPREKFFTLKYRLCWWNQHVFGDIFQHVMHAELMVDNEEEFYEFEPSILTRCYRDGILPPISGSFGHSQ